MHLECRWSLIHPIVSVLHRLWSLLLLVGITQCYECFLYIRFYYTNKGSIRLFEHYRTLTSLLSKILHWSQKVIALRNYKLYVTLNTIKNVQ